MDREALQELAQLRQREAKALLDQGFYAGAYYLAGYTIECALKACVAKQFLEHTVPERKLVNDFYTHELERLLSLARLRDLLFADPNLSICWLYPQRSRPTLDVVIAFRLLALLCRRWCGVDMDA